MKFKSILVSLLICYNVTSCMDEKTNKDLQKSDNSESFDYFVEQFADIKILRYQIPDFDQLNLNQKKLVYFLTQAGLSGRDIIWDQNYRYNLTIREALENVYLNYNGEKDSEHWKAFETYLKRVWFSNGIHHHYSNDKIRPEFTSEYLTGLLKQTSTKLEGEAFDVIFNDKDSKKVDLSAENGLLKSAVNFYSSDVTGEQVDAFYKAQKKVNDSTPISYGLNSKLVIDKEGKLVEQVWKSGGLYGRAIDEIIYWLENAKGVSENEKQKEALNLLIQYYKTGDLEKWDQYNIAWTEATDGDIDYINGFIEVYNDPKGYKGSYEMIVQIKDFQMSQKMAVIADNAQWFEDNSPIDSKHKKSKVVGVSYKTVNVAGEAGDASPATPIGVNLPNADWIRATHGSKSVSLANIIESYNSSGGQGRLKEFAFTPEEVELSLEYGKESGKMHTALHEVIGHASGKLNKGVGTPKETLKSYASTLEEARADLVGLYYLPSPKLVELNLSPDADKMGRVAYDNYIRNGLMTQLIRLNFGDHLEEAHMRNRQLVASWVYEKGKKDNVIEKVSKDGKTYFVIRDYKKLQDLFGDLLKEIQRIKSEGDYQAGKAIVETYGVKVNPEIHKEVLERNKKFTSAPYAGFVNPVLEPVYSLIDTIIDISVIQPKDFSTQMLNYSDKYGFLPNIN